MGLAMAGRLQTNRKPAAPLVYTVPEAGAMLGLSRNGAYEAARRGDIPAIRIGGRLIVPKIALHRLLEEVHSPRNARVAAPAAATARRSAQDG
jgi:excisionase family DNA binding protein